MPLPLTNGHGTCSVPVMGSDAFSSEIAEATVREACARLAPLGGRTQRQRSRAFISAGKSSMPWDCSMRSSRPSKRPSRIGSGVPRCSDSRPDARITFMFIALDCAVTGASTAARAAKTRPAVLPASSISSTSSNGSRSRSTAAWPPTRCACNRPAGSGWLMTSGTCRASRSAPEPMPSVWDSV